MKCSCSTPTYKEPYDHQPKPNEYLSKFTYVGRTEHNKVAGFEHKLPVWELMQIYGSVLGLGKEIPFERFEIDVISWE